MMNNKTIRMWAVGLLSLLILSGCETLGLNEYDKRNAESEALLARIDELRQLSVPNKVERIEQPPAQLTPMSQRTQVAYLSKTVAFDTPRGGAPLSSVLEDTVEPFGVRVWFGDDVSPEQRVTLSYQGTVSGLLNRLERQLNIGFTPVGQSLKAEKFVTRTFELELPPGHINDQLGSGGGESEGGEQTEGTAASSQHVTLSRSDVDVFAEMALGVEALLKVNPSEDSQESEAGGASDKEALVGSVQAISSLSRLIVRTTPTRMAEVSRLVNEAKASLVRQVSLEVQVLEFRSNLGHNRGIEWDLVREIGDGNSLKFFIPGTDLLSQTASPGFAFTGGGKWSGSTALINALNQQGQVSTQTPVTIVVQNYQTNQITQERTIEFLENISAESSEGVVSTDTTRGKRKEGVDFIVVPNIGPDFVHLRTSGMLTKIESLKPQKVGGETLIFPQIREAKINFQNKLKYGQTIVIGSVSQIETTTESNTFLGIPFLGGTSAVKQRVDTLVLLTPRRAN